MTGVFEQIDMVVRLSVPRSPDQIGAVVAEISGQVLYEYFKDPDRYQGAKVREIIIRWERPIQPGGQHGET
ncbi:MAG: hypothetical protein ACREA0_10245 [bacterium]